MEQKNAKSGVEIGHRTPAHNGGSISQAHTPIVVSVRRTTGERKKYKKKNLIGCQNLHCIDPPQARPGHLNYYCVAR